MPVRALRDGKVLIFGRATDITIEQEAVYGSFYCALQHHRRWTVVDMRRFRFLVEERRSASGSTKLLPKWNASSLSGAAMLFGSTRVRGRPFQQTSRQVATH